MKSSLPNPYSQRKISSVWDAGGVCFSGQDVSDMWIASTWLFREYNQPEVSFPRPRLRSCRLATGSKIGLMAKPLLGCGARRQFDAPLGCISASSAGRSHSEMRLGDEEPFWLSLTKEFVGAIKSLFSFLYDQPRQLRYIEWPTFSSTFKTATLTLVLVALLIIALATVDSGLCYFLALFLRRKP
ncbi:unnamed protein product [Rhodiola kirilowii]